MSVSMAVRRAATVVGMTVVLAEAPVAAQAEPFRWSGALAVGTVLEVKGIMGSIVAEPSASGQAEVIAEKSGRSGDFADVEIRVVEAPDGVTICAVYYPDDYVGDDCDLDDRRGDGDRNRNTRVDVDFTVRVPAGVSLIAAVVTGDVRARGLRSDVTAHSVTGDVDVSTTGVVEAGSVSGSLDVAMGSLDWTRLSFNTVSGDITVRMPEGLGTQVDFESLTGELDSDFDLVVERRRNGRWVGTEVTGTIGAGDRELRFHTVSGDVRLLRTR
jgi:hypothetical protein